MFYTVCGLDSHGLVITTLGSNWTDANNQPRFRTSHLPIYVEDHVGAKNKFSERKLYS